MVTLSDCVRLAGAAAGFSASPSRIKFCRLRAEAHRLSAHAWSTGAPRYVRIGGRTRPHRRHRGTIYPEEYPQPKRETGRASKKVTRRPTITRMVFR